MWGWVTFYFLHTNAHNTHFLTRTETRNLSCIGRDRCCHAQGDLTYRCRGDTNEREKPYCVCACVHVCMCVRVRLWQNLELKEAREKIGGGPARIHVWPGLFKVNVSFFTTLYWEGGRGEVVTVFIHQNNKFSIAVLLKCEVNVLLVSLTDHYETNSLVCANYYAVAMVIKG